MSWAYSIYMRERRVAGLVGKAEGK